MTSLVEHHRQAADEFGRRVHAVRQDQWTSATPCPEWDVRSLVNHLVNEQLWVPPLMGGATIAEVGDAFDGDVLGDDPVAAWDAASAAAAAALGASGALDRIVHLSFADVTGDVYAWQLTGDLAIHAWDLARGIGADEAIDPALAEVVAEKLAPDLAAYNEFGLFAASLPVADDAGPQARLLALTGRQA
jgi:uncharacterized protein (TIGR03086 family)